MSGPFTVGGPFSSKRVLLGVSGSIAAYKSIDLASKLTQAGATVNVLMSPSATRFVTPLTFLSITHEPVLTDLFDATSRQAIAHVALATDADVFVVAPATAHTIAKLALGLADDPISVIALATSAPLIIAPAMDANMWQHPAVQANVGTLTARGATIIGPAPGRLASGLIGWGRLAETPALLAAIATALGAHGDLVGRTIVVSAGGTQEAIDPVRVITNRSSGKMGYAIAEAARDRGANVVLVAAPTALADPSGVDVRHVESASDMRTAVLAACEGADAVIMAAAVADYTPADPAQDKLKKSASDDLTIDLVKTQDILAETPRNLVRVGFAAESTNLVEYATGKLKSKGLDFIVANDITLADSGFGADSNKVSIIDAKGVDDLPLMPKYGVATQILDRVVGLLP
jgi:phosphopantothenoylcysteine decarboxylase/phosphopantothenate--cysteine ligase